MNLYLELRSLPFYPLNYGGFYLFNAEKLGNSFFVEADDDANIVDRLTESQLQFTDNALDEVGDILSIDIKEVSITDSR